ncbi:cache domain-containing protein [Lacibacterium aquatile]|uniref:Cache domain-containing protein n=1 Tax=Lacibacterium aquatile TaxID=1168082 RepID=A0ABW5DQA4_9PROT
MKFSKSAPAILITSIIVVVATISIISNIISHRMAASFEEGTFAMMSEIVQSKLREAENKAIASAEIIAAMPDVKRAFAAHDKAALVAATKDAYTIQEEKYGISQAQFHLAPATSFLRVHNPDRPAEDLSKYRQIVLEVNRTGAIRKGIEVTTSGIGIFGTLPMTDETGKATGSFEMALEFGPLLDETKKAYGFEMGLYIEESILRDTATSLKAEFYSDQNRVGKFIKFHATHEALMRTLVTSDTINITDEATYLREAGDTPYGVLLQPVYNYAGKQIGVLAIAKNFSDTRSADGQAMILQALLGFISVVLLIGIVLMVVRGLLLRPLQALTARMEAGESTEDLATVSTEVQQIADYYEQRRPTKGRDTEGAA